MPNEADSEAGCQLLDSFAIFVQIVLASLAFSTLYIKRQRESPQRPLLIWLLDVSKQLIGGGIVHTLNIVASHLFGKSLEGEPQSNPCVWYFLNILIDTTLGVLIIWGVLAAINWLARFYRLRGFQSGVYGSPPLRNQLRIWTRQLSAYVMALVTMKVVVLILFSLCPWLERVGRWVLGWTMGNYRLQVLFVMLIFPLVMNIVQFWIVDTIVKNKPSRLIQLTEDEQEDMLISDGEYALPTQFHDDSDSEDNQPIASLHTMKRSDSTLSHLSADSLYELRTSQA
ncbi:vacuolar membrane protein-domain-containing protein [Blakeslea trispora]|nr:vacuolar membrane protein-domain-containing protein [Blakeslea trispora]